MKPALLAAALVATLPFAHSAGAAEAYLDDRSSAESLVRSLYNAINRKEYTRAYSYFSPAPAKSLDDYAKGYEDTENVELLTGAAGEEGAAGSIYYSLPVAIRATKTDGSDQVFAGCYTLRLADPLIQAESFMPLHIESAHLAAAEGELEDVLPAQCGDVPPPSPADRALRKAKTVFAAVYGETCENLYADHPDQSEPESYAIAFNYPYDSEDQPKRQARLFRFWCGAGAYNELHVYVLQDDSGDVKPLRFATPELDIQYENDDTDGAVEDMRIIGYTAEDQLVNSTFDADTQTLTSHNKWRGIGDAFSDGTWIFRSGAFTLVKYDVDASYDGKVDPQTMLDYHTGP